MEAFNVPLSKYSKNIISQEISFLKKEDTVIEALLMFENKKISLLPVWDNENNSIYGFFFLKDIFYLFTKSHFFSINVSVASFLEDLYKNIESQLPLGKDRLIYIQHNESTIKDVFEKIILSPEKKLIVYEEEKLLGIISLSDIFKISLS